MQELIDVLIIGDKTSPWLSRTASILEQYAYTHVTAPSFAEGAPWFFRVGAVVVLVDPATDPLVEVARLWEVRAQVPVVFLGDSINEDLRSAALEAGIAHVTRSEPTPEELMALLRTATEQSRIGSPELVRAICRTMCTLSTLVASASDTSFLSAAVLQISGLFQAHIVSILLYDDEDTDVMRVAAQVGLPASALYSPARKDGVAVRVAKEQLPRIILRSAANADRLEGVPGRSEITASMCVPIPGGARPRGVVNVAKTRACAVFTPRDLDMCVSIAGLVGDALRTIEAREMQATLQQRLAAVERLSTIGEIAGGIAHEVANPIACVRANVDTVIQYMTELSPVLATLDDGGPISAILDDLPALLCETWEGLQRTEDVVKQMKALVRLNSGSNSRDERVPLGALVDDTLRLLRPRLKVRVRVDAEPGVAVRGSGVELSQVLVNLIVNAADACEDRRMREPGHTSEVKIAVAADGAHAAIHIVDNGVGIEPALLKRIFMPLFTTKPGERGTGLGLSIVRRVVAEHGGTVRVHSTLGSGTAFVVHLPLLDGGTERLPAADDEASIV